MGVDKSITRSNARHIVLKPDMPTGAGLFAAAVASCLLTLVMIITINRQALFFLRQDQTLREGFDQAFIQE